MQFFKKKPAKSAPVSRLAEVLGVHPRTILRAITGNPTEYWVPSHNPRIRLSDVTRVYQVSVIALRGLLDGADKALTPDAAAFVMDISKRTLRNTKDYLPLVIGAGFLRFSNIDCERWAALRREAALDKIKKIF